MELEISCEKLYKEEIWKAIKPLKDGKASGPDTIPREAIKADNNTLMGLLHKLFSSLGDTKYQQSGQNDIW